MVQRSDCKIVIGIQMGQPLLETSSQLRDVLQELRERLGTAPRGGAPCAAVKSPDRLFDESQFPNLVLELKDRITKDWGWAECSPNPTRFCHGSERIFPKVRVSPIYAPDLTTTPRLLGSS